MTYEKHGVAIPLPEITERELRLIDLAVAKEVKRFARSNQIKIHSALTMEENILLAVDTDKAFRKLVNQFRQTVASEVLKTVGKVYYLREIQGVAPLI